MSRYVYDPSRPFGQRFVPVPVDWRPPPRPRLAVHGVKKPFLSMADGRWYDDHRTYRRELKARGYEELGNEMQECVGGQFEPNDWSNDLAETAREYGVSNIEEIGVPDGS